MAADSSASQAEGWQLQHGELPPSDLQRPPEDKQGGSQQPGDGGGPPPLAAAPPALFEVLARLLILDRSIRCTWS